MAKDIIHRSDFEKTISERKNRIKFCRNHNIENPVGKPIEIKEKPIINNGKKEDPPKIEPPKKLSFFDKIVAFFKSIFSRK